MTTARSQPRSLILEVCIDSVAGAVVAERAGADRVELCANLVEGGTTPSTGMIRAVLAATRLPVMAMIRPRGGHFWFTPQEQQTMIAEAEAVLAEPVAGIVVGALSESGDIDTPVVKRLVELAAGRSVTFHRAFDQTANPRRALKELIDSDVDRVLTSGQHPSALEGLDRLAELVAWSAGQISIMPGCGVRAQNVRRILDATGAHEVHFSGSRIVNQPTGFWRENVPMSGSSPGDLRRSVTDLNEVRAICLAARQD